MIGSTNLEGLIDAVSLKLDNVITANDDGSFSGLESDLGE